VNIMSGDQEFWMIGLGKRHLEEQCIWYSCIFFMWAFCWDQRKWTILVGKQSMWEQWIEVSVYYYSQFCNHPFYKLVTEIDSFSALAVLPYTKYSKTLYLHPWNAGYSWQVTCHLLKSV
jgi:hypothetical protein